MLYSATAHTSRMNRKTTRDFETDRIGVFELQEQ